MNYIRVQWYAFICNMFTYIGNEGLTYGQIIDIFEECDQTSPGDATHLTAAFKKVTPVLNVGRPGRFYDTIVRIVAPTRPALQNEKAALHGTPLHSYRERVWIPRIRNPNSSLAKGTVV